MGPVPAPGGEAAGPPRRERCDAVQNREKLLGAARELFAVQGLESTGMQEVARAAGVGQGTLYRHFANKGELCQALIRDDLDAFMAEVDAAAARDDGSGSPLDGLQALIADQLEMVERHLPLLAAIEAATGEPGPRPSGSPWRRWLRGHLTGLLSAAAERGEVAADVDTEYVADALLAVLSPRLVGLQRYELGYSHERIVAGARRVFVEGLRADRTVRE